jgi:hypothetical protein
MSVFGKVISYVKSNPLVIGVGLFGIGAIYLLSRGSGGAAAGQIAQANSTATAAYYAAESAQGTAGDQLAMAQINANAATSIAGIQAGTSVTNNTTWANADVTQTLSNNQTALAIAPVQAQAQTAQDLIGSLTQIAELPATTSTSTSKDGGFFGIGGGSKTTTTTTPNPAAATATAQLASLESLFYPSH